MTALRKANIKKADKGSMYTIVGAGGNVQEWVNGYHQLLDKAEIGKPVEWFISKGKDVNEEFKLEGVHRFPEDLTFLFFPLDGLNLSELAMFRLRMKDRWFDDLIDNSTRKEDEE